MSLAALIRAVTGLMMALLTWSAIGCGPTGEEYTAKGGHEVEGALGTASWEGESWRSAGGGNAWAPRAVDSERGLLYVGTSSPTNDYYGGPRDHPLLRGLELPALGSGVLGCALATPTLVIVTEGKGWFAKSFRRPNLWAFDKRTREVVGAIPLPATPRGCPMSYAVDGRQLIAVPIGDESEDPRLVALALPRPR
jgi:hypothetical protein